jgi:hypothetical protein
LFDRAPDLRLGDARVIPQRLHQLLDGLKVRQRVAPLSYARTRPPPPRPRTTTTLSRILTDTDRT